MSKEIKTVLVTVAKGNTVSAGRKSYGPGEKLELAADEARALMDRGVLVDPDQVKAQAEAPKKEGPSIAVAGGPAVTETP
jgi:hypothetical protein